MDEPGSGRVATQRSRRWIFVGLPLAQHPVAGFGQVPGDGDHGAAVPLARSQPLIEPFDVGAAIRLVTESYVLGQGGEQLTTVAWSAGASTWKNTNVYGEGTLLATYDAAGLHLCLCRHAF